MRCEDRIVGDWVVATHRFSDGNSAWLRVSGLCSEGNDTRQAAIDGILAYRSDPLL